MGLEIFYFSKARFHQKKECETSGHYMIDAYSEFTERLDGKKPGYYTCEGVEGSFTVGVHSWYGKWRELLSWVALGVDPDVVHENFEDYKGKPFIELIDMADNAGAIGPISSKKLAQDFENAKASIEEKLREVIKKRFLRRWCPEEDVKLWLEQFPKWHKAFLVASDDGFVSFT